MVANVAEAANPALCANKAVADMASFPSFRVFNCNCADDVRSLVRFSVVCVPVTAPATFGNVRLIDALISRRWSSAVERESVEPTGLLSTSASMKVAVSKAMMLPSPC